MMMDEDGGWGRLPLMDGDEAFVGLQRCYREREQPLLKWVN